ncbi:MAG: hypothetical protein U0324_43100 [Polyangiales bacterium]
MRRMLPAFALLAACSRPSPSRPAARPPATPSHAAAAAAPADDHEAEEQRQIANALREMSAFPDTDEGAQSFVTELARVARSGDRERWERMEHELVPDATRYELGLSFEGARLTRDRVVGGMEARARDLRERLAGMREPLTVTAVSATGAALADGAPHGFDPAVVRARAFVRPAVRYVRVDVADANGQRVSIQPLAFLAARWTWMGDFWNELPAPAPPAPPTGTAAAPARSAAAH